jgi:hypothetical protein
MSKNVDEHRSPSSHFLILSRSQISEFLKRLAGRSFDRQIEQKLRKRNRYADQKLAEDRNRHPGTIAASPQPTILANGSPS